MVTNGTYAPPTSRQMSIWLSNDDIAYVEQVAEDKGIKRNRAFALMIAEHRQAAERKAARKR